MIMKAPQLPPLPPEPPDPVPMPDPEDVVRKKRKQRAVVQPSGRASTILSDSETLG